MQTLDLRHAVLCEPDGAPVACDGPLIPESVYGRRVRVVHIHGEKGIRIMRVRLDMETMSSKVGENISVSRMTARTGQRCMMMRGSKGGILMGDGYTSLSRRTVRGVREFVSGAGVLEVRF